MKLSWDSLASLYDRQLWLEQPAVRMALDLAAVTCDERVVDVGTGTGAALRELQRRGIRPAAVLGVDRSRAMLARVPPLPSGWRLQRASASHLPLANASVEVALAVFLLHVLSDRQRRACLRELRRVLTTDGRLVIVTPDYPTAALSRVAYQALLRAIQLISRDIAKTLRPIELESQLQAAGFEVEIDRRSTGGYPARCLMARPTNPNGS